jgi:hypothetical protein
MRGYIVGAIGKDHNMKKLLFAVVVMLVVPKAHAAGCTVSVTPPSFTLQINETQLFAATTSNCTPGGTFSWALSCTGTSCKTGTLNSKTISSPVYTAPNAASGSAATPWVAQLTATYKVNSSSFNSSPADVTITAVQINSLVPPAAALSPWETNVLGTTYPSTLVSGVNYLLDWATIDTNNGNTTTINSNLSSVDTAIAAYFPASNPTRKINFIVQGVTGGNAIGGGAPNTSTPSYVLTAPGLNIYNNCGYGKMTNPATGLNGGFPAVWESAYFQAYQTFIQTVLTHYSSPSNSILANYIGYIRFGLSAGGETYAFCDTGNSDNTWEGYVSAMDSWMKGKTSIQLMTSINQDNSEQGYALPDYEAGAAWGSSIGFGSQGLQQQDYGQGNTCTSDWCNMFGKYYNDSPVVPLELQTVLLSDPIPNDPPVGGTPSQTGSLSMLIPFSIQNHAEIFELYPFDLLYAFDSNYCNLAGADLSFCSGSTKTYPSCYENVIEAAGNGVANLTMTLCVKNQ